MDIHSKHFKANKLSKDQNYADASDAYANNGFVISFYHIPSGKEVYFKAFIMAYNETYTSDWAEEIVYGRADPIYLFKNTRRNITLGLKIPAATQSEAYENLAKLQTLTQFLYPAYTDVQNALTISQSPLVRLKVMNLLASTGYSEAYQAWAQSSDIRATGGGETGAQGIIFDPEQMKDVSPQTSDASLGILGVLKNLSIVHNLEGDQGVMEMAPGLILPKNIEINFDFGVIHESELGWDNQGSFTSPLFPYSLDIESTGNTSQEQVRKELAEAAAAAALAAAAGTNSGGAEDPLAAAAADAQTRYNEARESATAETLYQHDIPGGLRDESYSPIPGQRVAAEEANAQALAAQAAAEMGLNPDTGMWDLDDSYNEDAEIDEYQHRVGDTYYRVLEED